MAHVASGDCFSGRTSVLSDDSSYGCSSAPLKSNNVFKPFIHFLQRQQKTQPTCRFTANLRKLATSEFFHTFFLLIVTCFLALITHRNTDFIATATRTNEKNDLPVLKDACFAPENIPTGF